jgi:hypothetical protein
MSSADNNTTPQDVEAKREALARKLSTFAGHHRRCRDTRCRRHKRCIGLTWACDELPKRQVAAEDQARMFAELRRMLAARMAVLAEGKEGGSGVSARQPYPCKVSPDRPASRRRGARS